MIDAALVGRKALLITRDLTDLAPLARTPLADYLANARDELVAERLLERIIGRMIDINYHLLTETAHPPPADYYAHANDEILIVASSKNCEALPICRLCCREVALGLINIREPTKVQSGGIVIVAYLRVPERSSKQFLCFCEMAP